MIKTHPTHAMLRAFAADELSLPLAVGVLTPGAGAQDVSLTPTLSWDAVDGWDNFVSYIVEIAIFRYLNTMGAAVVVILLDAVVIYHLFNKKES